MRDIREVPVKDNTFDIASIFYKLNWKIQCILPTL